MFVQVRAISEYYHNETINPTYLTVILHTKVVFCFCMIVVRILNNRYHSFLTFCSLTTILRYFCRGQTIKISISYGLLLVHISSHNGLLPDVTNPLPESVVIHDKLDALELNFKEIF